EEPLLGPLREFFVRPRKDFRARILRFAWELGGGSGEPPQNGLLLIEALHSGSLIVDDIQDRSTERRGGPALHLVIGEPLAINAGNWLYFHAAALAGKLGLSPRAELELRRAINDTVLRCHLGQALDLGVRIGSLPQRRVAPMVRTATALKTGSLLELAARSGALLANADVSAVETLATFGNELGVALQMLDDVSGIYNAARFHKGHEDLIQGRPTWPWAWLAEHVDELGYTRIQHIARDVEAGVVRPETLAEHLRERLGDEPLTRAREHLSRAIDGLRSRFTQTPAFLELEAHVLALEASYVG
ncbi:MAG TPA: polyprenyl synthetase family protein, partial [Polyangiaceae bacterium]